MANKCPDIQSQWEKMIQDPPKTEQSCQVFFKDLNKQLTTIVQKSCSVNTQPLFPMIKQCSDHIHRPSLS